MKTLIGIAACLIIVLSVVLAVETTNRPTAPILKESRADRKKRER